MVQVKINRLLLYANPVLSVVINALGIAGVLLITSLPGIAFGTLVAMCVRNINFEEAAFLLGFSLCWLYTLACIFIFTWARYLLNPFYGGYLLGISELVIGVIVTLHLVIIDFLSGLYSLFEFPWKF